MEDTFINIPENTDIGAVQIATIALPGETAQLQEVATVHGFLGGDTINTVTSIALSSAVANIAYNEASPWTKDTAGVFSIPEKAKGILLAPSAYTPTLLTERNDLEVVLVLVLLHEIAGKLYPFAYFSSPEEQPTVGVPNFQNSSDGTTGEVFLYNDLMRNYGVPPMLPTLGCPYGRLFLHKVSTTPTAPLTTSLTVNLLFLDHFVGGADFGGMSRGAEDLFFPSDMAGDQ